VASESKTSAADVIRLLGGLGVADLDRVEIGADAGPPPPAAAEQPPDVVERLAQLAELHERGELTDGEFATMKARLIDGS
jgi:hypothetical protein